MREILCECDKLINLTFAIQFYIVTFRNKEIIIINTVEDISQLRFLEQFYSGNLSYLLLNGQY